MKTSPATLVSVMQSMVGRVLFTVITALTGILTARLLHPAGRGELSALGVWPNFLGGLMTLGLPSALIFWTRSEPKEKVNFIWASVPLTLALSACAVLIGIVGIPYWLSQYGTEVIHNAQWLMTNACIVLFIANANALCEAEADFLSPSIALCLTPICTLLGLVALAATHRFSPLTAACAYMAGGVPSFIFLMTRIIPQLKIRPTKLGKAGTKLVSYGLRSYGVDICGTLSLYADQAVVVHTLAPSAMGTYVVALSLSRTLGVVFQTVAAVLFPKAVARSSEDLLSMTGRAVRVSMTLTVSIGLVIALFGPQLLSVMYGREYRSAVVILDLLIAEAILTGMALVLTRAYMAIGKPGVVTILQSSGLLLSLPLLAMLVPRMGVVGAGLALLIAAVARLLITLTSFQFVMQSRAPSLVPRLIELGELVGTMKGLVTDRWRKRATAE